MKKNHMVPWAIGIFVVGFAAGVLFSAWKLDSGPSAAVETATESAPQEQANPQMEVMARIAALAKILETEPNSAGVLTQMGNDYFDLGNYRKSIECYGKSLEVDPNKPDVLADMAIAYRKIGEYQLAADTFRKAIELNPKHQLALFNMGIVLRDDLKDDKGALDTWRRFLDVAGDSRFAVMVKPWVKQLEDKTAQSGATPAEEPAPVVPETPPETSPQAQSPPTGAADHPDATDRRPMAGDESSQSQ